MPTTRTVSVRNLRENLSKFLDETQKHNVHFIVMRYSEVVAYVTPAKPVDSSLEALVKDVAIARQQAKKGKTYTPEQVLSMIDKHEARLHRKIGKRH